MYSLDLYENSRQTKTGVTFLGINDQKYVRLHWHEHIEVHFVTSGILEHQCGDQMLHLKKHDCLVINSNELHGGPAGKDTKIFQFKIHPSFFDHKQYTFRNLIHDDTVIFLMNKLIEVYKKNDDSSILLAKGYIFQLLGHLCEHYTTRTLSLNAQQQSNEKLEKMNSVALFMHNNYATEISTQKLAQMTLYNYSHFCRTFKEVFGMTASEYLLSIRINKASALLSTTDMNITEIAATSGFPDANYFARIFKRETGLSPSKYREQVKTKTDSN